MQGVLLAQPMFTGDVCADWCCWLVCVLDQMPAELCKEHSACCLPRITLRFGVCYLVRECFTSTEALPSLCTLLLLHPAAAAATVLLPLLLQL
jgi:hypothetical protein